MQECAQKFDKRIKFSKIQYVLQEVGTNSRIHTFRMQECAENYEKTPNVDNSSLDPMLQSHLLLLLVDVLLLGRQHPHQ